MIPLDVLLFIVCLACAAFFAGAETALMSVSLSTWDRLRAERPDMGSAYRLWSNDPSVVLATLLLGNTLASLGASILSTVIVHQYRPMLAGAAYLFVTSLFAGSTILIFGEIIPKLYARHSQEKVLIWLARPLVVTTLFLRPFLQVLTLLSDGIKKLLSAQPSEPLMTTQELRQALSPTNSEGLEPTARRVLSNLIAFDKVQVHEVMIPRNQVITVRMEQNTERMFEYIVRSGFSRIPVYFGNIDNILGIVYAKDLLAEWRSSGLLVLEDLLRPPYRIAPEASLAVLLQGFRQGHHLAVVTDAQGRTQGIVTIEDVVEAIVGDIADEFDQPLSASPSL